MTKQILKMIPLSLIIGFMIPGMIGYGQDVTFPRNITNQGSVLTFYQPQVHQWTKHEVLDFRAAFSLKPNGGKEAIGVLYMKARTDVNMETHRVLIDNMSITDVHFPSMRSDSAEKMAANVKKFLTPDRSLVMSLEQIVSYMEQDSTGKGIQVNTNPPIIFYSKKPTILLQTEGPAQKTAAGKESLEFVFNANTRFSSIKPGIVIFFMMAWAGKKHQPLMVPGLSRPPCQNQSPISQKTPTGCTWPPFFRRPRAL